MADSRTGSKIEKSVSGEIFAYSFSYLIDISGTINIFKVDIFASEMIDDTDLDEAKATADAAASSWKAVQNGNPDPIIAISIPAFTGTPDL